MSSFQNPYQAILVANEELPSLDIALEKAAQLVCCRDTKLTLLEVIYDELERETDSVLPRSEKERLIRAYTKAERHALIEIANKYRNYPGTISTEVSWCESPEIGICRYALRQHKDLIVKPFIKADSLFDLLCHSSVHKLISLATAPVLISRIEDWSSNAAILACVDVSDDRHRILNHNIVHHAQVLADQLRVPLHLLTVVAPPPLSLGQFSSTFDVSAMQDRLLDTRRQEMRRLQENMNTPIEGVFVHINTGTLIDEMRGLSNEISADIAVMGTASREGLRRFLIGNSAETALYRLDLDILFIKEDWLENSDYGD